MKTYKWNDVVKLVVTPVVVNIDGIEMKFNEYRVFLACGATAVDGGSESQAVSMAELEWHNNNRNQFVIRDGAPRHVEMVNMTRDEVLERVSFATI